MQISDLEKILKKCWCKKTSAFPKLWSKKNPAWGQCAITALIVQDYFGGILLRGMTNFGSHYWNKLPDGTEVDLTRGQFPEGTIIENAAYKKRDYIISYAPVVARYNILKKKVENLLK